MTKQKIDYINKNDLFIVLINVFIFLISLSVIEIAVTYQSLYIYKISIINGFLNGIIQNDLEMIIFFFFF